MISVMGNHFDSSPWALGSLAMPLVVSLSHTLFLRTGMVQMHVHSSIDCQSTVLCTDEACFYRDGYSSVSMFMKLEHLGF